MISSFSGKYRFLSNFYEIPNGYIVYEGVAQPTVEHAYQAAKTHDRDVKLAVAQIKSPGTVKRLGQQFILRPDWEDVKIFVMYELLCLKFDTYGPPINSATIETQQLLDTHPHDLMEGNNWGDEFWGVTQNGGQNWLGRLLQLRRDELRWKLRA